LNSLALELESRPLWTKNCRIKNGAFCRHYDYRL